MQVYAAKGFNAAAKTETLHTCHNFVRLLATLARVLVLCMLVKGCDKLCSHTAHTEQPAQPIVQQGISEMTICVHQLQQ